MLENGESMDAPKSVLLHWKYNNYEQKYEIIEPMDAPKFEYFLRKYEDS